MTSVGVAPTSGLRESSGHPADVDRLPEEMNDMRIRDDKVCYSLSQFFPFSFNFGFFLFLRRFTSQEMEAATIVDGNGTEAGHIIVTTIGGRNGQPKQVYHNLSVLVSYPVILLWFIGNNVTLLRVSCMILWFLWECLFLLL